MIISNKTLHQSIKIYLVLLVGIAVIMVSLITALTVKEQHISVTGQANAAAINLKMLYDSDFAPTAEFRYNSVAGIPLQTPICYISGYPTDKSLQPTSWDMSPFTGYSIAEPRQSFQKTVNPGYYGSSGCQAKGSRFGYMLNNVLDAKANTVNQGIRTAQMFVALSSGTQMYPWSSQQYGSNPRLRLQTYYKKQASSIQNGAAQQVYMYVAIVDAVSAQSFWYTIALWDSRGAAMNKFQPVISDLVAGGGTTNFNVLANLNTNSPQSKLVTRHFASQDSLGTTIPGTIPNWYAGYISKANMQYAVSAANNLIAQYKSKGMMQNTKYYSSDIEKYYVSAFAIDGESSGVGPKQDWFGFSSWSSKLMVEY